MQQANPMCDCLIQEFIKNHMEKMFYFCLKKTGNNSEADDLVQDITLNIISALKKGMIPTSFSAWVCKLRAIVILYGQTKSVDETSR